MRTRLFAVLASVLSLLACASQLYAAPASAEKDAVIAIVHGRVYVPGARAPLPDANVVLDQGKVRAIGPDAPVPPGATVVDARGKVLTPGFIDANDAVGVVDVDLEPASNDTDVRGQMTPALRMADAYNPRSILISIARSGGVTSAIVAPRAGVLGGQATFVDFVGDDVPSPVVRASLAQYAYVDETSAQASTGTRGGLWAMLRQAFEDARFYAAHKAQYDANASRPLSLNRSSLEALGPVLKREQLLVVTAHRASDIEETLRFADELGLRVAIQGASEAWMLAGELAARKVPVVIDPLQDLPARFDMLHARADNAARLDRAGVPVVIATFDAHQVRLLWQHAGNAVRAGMDHDAAIRAVTEVPASVFGLKGYGRLEPGAVGNVVVWSGDPLQTSTRIEHVFVRGRDAPLETRQKLLLERYRTLPARRDGSP